MLLKKVQFKQSSKYINEFYQIIKCSSRVNQEGRSHFGPLVYKKILPWYIIDGLNRLSDYIVDQNWKIKT